jgi:FkbM family methyltransferase
MAGARLHQEKLRRWARLAAPYVPGLLDAFRAWRLRRLLARPPVTTPLGFTFVGPPAMQRGEHEPEEVALVQRALGCSEVFINVGANFGYYCCVACHLGKRVIAFEPLQGNLRILYRNMKANGWGDVEIYPVALGERIALVELFGSGTSASLIGGWAGGNRLFHRTVPMNTLDNMLGDRLYGHRCAFLIDIEGGEFQCLQGARRQLALQPPPIWFVEILATQHQPRGVEINPRFLDTFRLLWECGYETWTVESVPRIVQPREILQIATKSGTRTLSQSFLFLRHDMPREERARVALSRM